MTYIVSGGALNSTYSLTKPNNEAGMKPMLTKLAGSHYNSQRL